MTFNNLEKIKALKEDVNRIKKEKAVLEKKLTNSEKKILNNSNKKILSKSVGKCLISESKKLFPLNSVKTDLANSFSNNNTCVMDKTTSLDRSINNSPKLKSNKFEVLSKLSDEDTVEKGIVVNTDDAEEKFSKLNDNKFI